MVFGGINYDSIINTTDSSVVKMRLYRQWVSAVTGESAEVQDRVITKYIIEAERNGTERDVYDAYTAKLIKYRLFAEFKKNLAVIEKIEAMPYYQKQFEAQVYIQTQYALTLHRMGNYDGAVEHYNGILEKIISADIAPSWKAPMQGRILRMMAQVYSSNEKYTEAIITLKEAQLFMQKADYEAGEFSCKKDLAAAYVKSGKCDSALVLASNASNFFLKKGNQFYSAHSERSVAEAYGCIGDTIKQLEYLGTALDKVRQTRFKSLEFSILLDLSQYYFYRKESKVSELYLDSALLLIQRAQQSERLRFYDFSYDFFLANENKKKAYESRAAYQMVKNEIYETRTIANLAYLDSKADNLLAINDLKLVQDANQLEQLKLENSKFNEKILLISLVVLGTLILALITLFFIIRNNIKNKKKYNTLLGYTNKQTSDLLQQKEQLLREIHLRVKNNLQIIISVLNLHKSEQTDKSRVIESCKSQIQTMALIHEEIYKSDDLESISFKTYMDEMVKYFLKSNTAKSGFKMELNLDDFELNLDTIIPTGLIINELLSLLTDDKNAYQRIVLSAKNEDSKYSFRIEDSNPQKKSARNDLRIRIADKLITKQLMGDVDFVYIGDMIKSVEFSFNELKN